MAFCYDKAVSDKEITKIECLEDAAEAVDNSQSWQFLAGSRDHDEYSLFVVSRGVIALVQEDDFEGISDRIEIERDPGDSFSKLHIVRYVGDLLGLEMFVEHITGDLDGCNEGNVDVIGDFVSRNPLWALQVFGRGQAE